MSDLTPPKMSSVLGQTAVVFGNVRGTGDLEVRGRIQGSVELDGRLLVAESGTILGGVEAILITVAGEVRGDLIAEDGVVILASGRVEGNIAAPRVGIEAGARVRGNLRTGDELPSRVQVPQAVASKQVDVRPVTPPTPAPAPASKLRSDPPAAPAAIEPVRLGTTELENALDELLKGVSDNDDDDDFSAEPAKEERSGKRRRRRRGGGGGEPRNQEARGTESRVSSQQEVEAQAAESAPSKVQKQRPPQESAGKVQRAFPVPPAAGKQKIEDDAAPRSAEPAQQPDIKKARPARPTGAPKVPTFAKGAKGKHRD